MFDTIVFDKNKQMCHTISCVKILHDNSKHYQILLNQILFDNILFPKSCLTRFCLAELCLAHYSLSNKFLFDRSVGKLVFNKILFDSIFDRILFDIILSDKIVRHEIIFDKIVFVTKKVCLTPDCQNRFAERRVTNKLVCKFRLTRACWTELRSTESCLANDRLTKSGLTCLTKSCLKTPNPVCYFLLTTYCLTKSCDKVSFDAISFGPYLFLDGWVSIGPVPRNSMSVDPENQWPLKDMMLDHNFFDGWAVATQCQENRCLRIQKINDL